MSSNPDYRVTYDENGNIVFQFGEENPIQPKKEIVVPAKDAAPHTPLNREEVEWTIEEPVSAYEAEAPRKEAPVQSQARAEIAQAWRTVRHQLFHTARSALEEGGKQYRASARDTTKIAIGTLPALRGGLMRMWSFLTQPVWIPGKRDRPKQMSRGTLFALDIFRFGGTFAALFLGLFLVLNYESFWEIARARIDPLAEAGRAEELSDEMDGSLARKLLQSPFTANAGRLEGHLLSFLPPVGPPDNRLVIPSLGLNVPIAIPAADSLMREDWKTLEEDIQESLQDGVVHYPGTARPGQAGNFFVTGHSSYFPWAPGAFKSVFARLHALNVGDEYWVFYGGDKHRYVIKEKKEVKPSDVSVLDQPVNKRLSTLMTCTPVGTTLRRLIIVAQEVDPLTAEPLEVGEHIADERLPKMQMEMLPI